LGVEKAFDLNGHDEKISEIYSNLVQNVRFCPGLDQVDWFGFKNPVEKDLTGPNGPRVGVGPVEEVAVTG
jgi:hypothetical protein